MAVYFGMHNHTQYSNITTGLDSINKLSDLVRRAKELQMTGVAITNHDNLSEVIEINKMQKQLKKDGDNFVVAMGNEIYLVDEFEDNDAKDMKRFYYHFILIAKDSVGYQQLIELSTRAWYRSVIQRGRRRVPTLKSDIEEIVGTNPGHLVATSACLGGELPKLILEGKENEAKEFIKWCQTQFGIKDFYIELQPSLIEDQIKFNKKIFSMSFDAEPPNFIIATDAHYQDAENFPIFEAFLRSKQENREVKEYYDYARLMGEIEIFELLNYLPEVAVRQMLDNTIEIKNQIEFYDLTQDPKIPKVKLPQILLNHEHTTNEYRYPNISWALQSADYQTVYCARYCCNKLKELNKWNDQYLSRLDEEFDTFKYQSEQLQDNFFSYVNTIQHYLELAWSVDCAVGPSRGSASGCLICYLMGVVQCDPIQYDLPFWRFLNKVRTSPLDVDLDFQPSKRQELFKAIREERGELGLTQVATYRTLTLKAAIGNAARGYRNKEFPKGLDPDISTYLSSLIEVKRGFVATLYQTLNGDETTGFNINHSFIKECKTYPGLLEIIEKIEGLIVGSSTHAAAVILFDEQDKLTSHCSLMRAPNGDLCSALDLHTVEEAGCYKYDFLLLSTLDIQATCFKLLQKDKVIPPELTLKECFRKYINPNTIDFNEPEIWEKIYNNEVLSIFQWDSAVARKGILAAKPQNLFELTSLNGLIRLMTADGEENQIQRFVRFKENPELFEQEMVVAGLSEEQKKHMHEELDKYNGCAATQESFMILSQKLAGFTLKQADALRKTVAKKKMNEITSQKELFFSKLGDNSEKVKNYLWSVICEPSMGYSFSICHGLIYSMIGVQCVLMGGVLFHPIYWQTACLLQRSGSLDGKTSDYNKIAKAVSMISKQGVNIRPVDINTSEREFSLDVTKNVIYFGLDGVKGLKSKVIESIMEKRPFASMLDFMVRTKSDIASTVTLIKAGAFDEFNSRVDNIEIISKMQSGQKEKLNGQNFLMLSRDGFWAQDTPELKYAQRVFNFTQHLKNLASKAAIDDEYPLDDRACEFLDEIGYSHDGASINKRAWKSFYDIALLPMKQYLIDNQEEMLEKVNKQIIQNWKEKYFSSIDFAQGEIETMGLCFAEHPMERVINVADFDELPREPEIQNIYTTKTGRSIPMFRLTMICGIAIAKDKLHNSITLLTATGPVEVRFRKEQFAAYDQQVSQQIGGRKQIIEKSWLNRGTGLIIHGMRQDDLFVAKTYKNSPMSHTVFKIIKVLETGKLEVQKQRKKGRVEESGDEE